MKLIVMAHRMRTQRIGEDSVARELFVYEGDEKDARRVLKECREASKRKLAAGYPWKADSVVEGFDCSIYDEFYLKVKE
jgi:hypothetical protein